MTRRAPAYPTDRIRRLHDRWSTGNVVPVLSQLRASAEAAADHSEKLRFRALEARFLAHSGLLSSARRMFDALGRDRMDRVSDTTRCWVAYCQGYFAFEVARDFSASEAALREALRLARREPPASDTSLLMTAACWRIAAIAQARGDASAYRRMIDAASSLAKSSEDPHMVGAVLLARGHREFALGNFTGAEDCFLQGLLCVEYGSESIPHYLHAELMLGLTMAQVLHRRQRRRAALLHCAQALEKVRGVLSHGKGYVVLPYPRGCVVDPRALLTQVYGADAEVALNRRRLVSAVRERIRRLFRDRCARCDGRSTITIDHIIPRVWGGTDWTGNLRVLCTHCNSSRKHHFAVADEKGYRRLRLELDRLGAID